MVVFASGAIPNELNTSSTSDNNNLTALQRKLQEQGFQAAAPQQNAALEQTTVLQQTTALQQTVTTVLQQTAEPHHTVHAAPPQQIGCQPPQQMNTAEILAEAESIRARIAAQTLEEAKEKMQQEGEVEEVEKVKRTYCLIF
jgi:hypothetical protein